MHAESQTAFQTPTAPMTAAFRPAQISAPFQLASDSDILDPALLRAIAGFARTRGAVRFTPGGGVLFDTPATRDERRALPTAQEIAPRFLDLPEDRFHATYATRPDFAAFVDKFTVPHSRAGYRLVVIPLKQALDADALLAIADAAESFGHGTIRLSAQVSIRLPNVPSALLRPLFERLRRGGVPVLRQRMPDAA